jgi:hypoxanthine phosphoribosyltransferase
VCVSVKLDAEIAAVVLQQADRLFSAREVEAALDALATAITAALGERDPLLLCAMTGGVVTLGRLLTRLAFPLQVDYLHATRYRGETRGGSLQWRVHPQQALRDRNVLLVDDILDEGDTLAAMRAHCTAEGAASVQAAVLVEKQHRRKHPEARAEFIGLRVPDRYVFGYGMDYHEYLRNADGIYAARDS